MPPPKRGMPAWLPSTPRAPSRAAPDETMLTGLDGSGGKQPAHFHRGDDTTKRREQVRSLHLLGYSPARIHALMSAPGSDYAGISVGQIRVDLDTVKSELLVAAAPSIEDAHAQSIGFNRELLALAYQVAMQAPLDANTKVQAMDVAARVQARIDDLLGVGAPEKLTSRAMAAFQTMVLELLAEEADAELVQRLMARIAQHTGTSYGRLLPPSPTTVVDAEAEEDDTEETAAESPETVGVAEQGVEMAANTVVEADDGMPPF